MNSNETVIAYAVDKNGDENGIELPIKVAIGKEIFVDNHHNGKENNYFDSIEITKIVKVVNSVNAFSQYINFRYLIIRFFTIPLKCLPVSFPFIGGRTLIELLYIILGIVISIAIFSKQDTDDSGSISTILAGASVLFSLRNNILTIVCGVSFERAMFYHKWAGVFAIITGFIHGYIALWKGDSDDGHHDRRLDGYDGPPPTSVSTFFNAIKDDDNFTGFLLLLLMMLTACSYVVKNYWFEIFYYFHFTVSFAIFIFALMHEAGFLAFCYGVWMADLFLRYILTLKKSTNVSAIVLDAGVICLTIPKEFEYKSGQYCFIMIPSLNMFEYHPFSISSSPNETNLTFHIRTLGDWTAKLENHIKAEYFKSNNSSNHIKPNCSMDMYIEGPFGVSAIDIDNQDYEVLLLVSGGIGVTPLQSIFNDLRYQHNSNIRRLKKVIFIWSVRDVGIIDAMHNPELEVKQFDVGFVPNLIKDSDTLIANNDINSEEVFHSEFYLTRYKNSEQVDLSILDLKDRNYVRFGRPDLADIFNKTTLYCNENGINRIAVATCGPLSMVDEVQRQCNIKNGGKISFDLQKEVFDF
jgi:NADPH oxidase